MAVALPFGAWTRMDVLHSVDSRHLIVLISSPTACGAAKGRGDVSGVFVTVTNCKSFAPHLQFLSSFQLVLVLSPMIQVVAVSLLCKIWPSPLCTR